MDTDKPKVVKSSLIRSYSYDINSKTLTVQFVSDEATDHIYLNVMPPTISAVFDAPGSIGSKFHKLIVKAGIKHHVKQQESSSKE